MNAVEQAKEMIEPLPTKGKEFWTALQPFGSCLGASTLIYHALHDAIPNHPDPQVAKYADTVQLLTCAKHATSETQYHVIVALCFDTFALTIDHPLHPTAFKVPLGCDFAMTPYIPLFSEKGQERFSYFVTDEEDGGIYMLTMHSTINSYPALSFTPMHVDATVAQLAIPAASKRKPLKGTSEQDEGVLLPPRKYVSVRMLLDEEPRCIASTPLHGKFLITALRVQVDFGEPALLFQIPRADWLDRAQGRAWVDRVRLFEGYVEECEATVHVVLRLGATTRSAPCRREREQIEMLGALAEAFGLEKEVIEDMVDAIYRAWVPYRGMSFCVCS
ncbi:hypothetical protein BDW02DRAFT_599565 [Decorospora gaudefroyi]|uniref:Uncharacterized protein n=1 Tax=Decorospora gaudefroyi TaxID=184978 RepID=A0A6A5KC90_9PLEO|nr:hypothetical protein BDW02DRAFT_599565 [Decorospora gaudefroyi]